MCRAVSASEFIPQQEIRCQDWFPKTDCATVRVACSWCSMILPVRKSLRVQRIQSKYKLKFGVHFWLTFEAFWVTLACFLDTMEAFWVTLGVLGWPWGPLWCLSVPFGVSRGLLGGPLGSSWSPLGRFGGALGVQNSSKVVPNGSWLT